MKTPDLFSVLTAKIYGVAAIVWCVLFAVQTARIEGVLWIDGFQDTIAALEQQIKEHDAASAENRRKAVDQVKTTEATTATIARRADDEQPETVRDRRAADAYADAHRVRGDQICRRDPAGAAAPGPAQSGDRPGEAPERILVTRPDYDLFVENQLRLERINRWGEDLIAAKLAVTEAEFAREDPAGAE